MSNPRHFQFSAQTRAVIRLPGALLLACLLACGRLAAAAAQPASSPAAPSPAAAASPSPSAAQQEFYIREYRVTGAHHLKPVEVEAAVYPFLGPGRTLQDVEAARQALVKAYQDKNYSSVQVVVPPQNGAGGIVFLQVNELTVGRLRVEGSRYFDINHIKKQIPSMAPGQLIDFTQAQKELLGLNQLPDRRITPSIVPGVVPGTMDVDLTVKDTPPLHGSLELNNRYSSGTPSLRLAGSLSYDNLWQLGHSVGGSFEISPQNESKVNVFTGFYTVRFPDAPWLSLTAQATDQNSDVTSLGALDSLGKGQIYGLHASIMLPTLGDYFHHFGFGLDYKHLLQNIVQNDAPIPFGTTLTNYIPITLEYSGTRSAKDSITDVDLQVIFGIRGIGSDDQSFENARHGADRNFVYLRGDIDDTQDLPWDLQLFGKIAGQVSDSPLVPSEQFSVGGEDTVRGYLESEELGDDAAVGNLEFRSPSMLGWMKNVGDEWRVYAFADGAIAQLQDTLPSQQGRFYLASFGVGSRLELFDHFNAVVDVAWPTTSQTYTRSGHPLVTFRVFSDF